MIFLRHFTLLLLLLTGLNTSYAQVIRLSQTAISKAVILDHGWRDRQGKTIDMGQWVYATEKQNTSYFLTIRVPEENTHYYLKFTDLAWNYQLWNNGKLVYPANTAAFCNSFQPQLITLQPNHGILQLEVKVRSKEGVSSTILKPPLFGKLNAIYTASVSESIKGYFLIGSLIICLLFQVVLFVELKRRKLFLFLSISIVFFCIHMLFLNQRFLQDFLSWDTSLMLRLEYAVAITANFFTFKAFQIWIEYNRAKNINRWLVPIYVALLFVTLGLPFSVTSQVFHWIAPLLFAGTISYGIYLFFTIIRRENLNKLPFVLVIIAFVTTFIIDEMYVVKHIGEVVYMHYAYFLFNIIITLMNMRKTAKSYSEVQRLSSELQTRNMQLMENNISLKQLVTEKSNELLQTAEQLHALEIQAKQRDLESIVAHTRLKNETTLKILHQLEKIAKSGENAAEGVRKLIKEVKGILRSHNKLSAFEQQMDEVNQQFFHRLTDLYPDLTKTEREMCSLIRLNLHVKEISEILNCTPDSIYVMRSRIKRKFKLDDSTDLDVFIKRV